MLQNIIEYLVQNPDVKEKVKEGTASLVGLSEMEHKAVLDVVRISASSSGSPLEYW